MPVYTTNESDEPERILSSYPAGRQRDLEGISDGSENTTYFVNTRDADDGRYVLSPFEHHVLEEMHYYHDLMHYLTHYRVPRTDPVADSEAYCGYWT